MDNDGIQSLKRAGLLFLGVLFLYITLYGGCMALRQKGGPWVVIETQDAAGVPIVQLEHHLRLTNGPVTLSFPGEKTSDPAVRQRYLRVFRAPNTNAMPYGPVEFVDVTFLPGTVAFDAFGHLIEVQPRVLYLDGRETPWVSGTNIVMNAGDKLTADRRRRRP